MNEVVRSGKQMARLLHIINIPWRAATKIFFKKVNPGKAMIIKDSTDEYETSNKYVGLHAHV